MIAEAEVLIVDQQKAFKLLKRACEKIGLITLAAQVKRDEGIIPYWS